MTTGFQKEGLLVAISMTDTVVGRSACCFTSRQGKVKKGGGTTAFRIRHEKNDVVRSGMLSAHRRKNNKGRYDSPLVVVISSSSHTLSVNGGRGIHGGLKYLETPSSVVVVIGESGIFLLYHSRGLDYHTVQRKSSADRKQTQVRK